MPQVLSGLRTVRRFLRGVVPRQAEIGRGGAQAILVALAHGACERVPDGGVEIERGKILAVIADVDARFYDLAFGVASRKRFEQRGLADAVRTHQVQTFAAF